MLKLHNLKLNDFLLNIKLKKNTFAITRKYICILNAKNFKQFSKNLFNKKKINILNFFINISLNKSNLFLHIMNSLGNEIYFYSVGTLFKIKKKNIKKAEILKKFSEILLMKFDFLKNTPIAIHINSDLNFTKLFIEKLKNKLFITFVRIFTFYPYNGCRKKKEEMAEWFKAVDCKSI